MDKASRPLYQAKAEFFKTLGHPARIRVLELLSERERAVVRLGDTPALGAKSGPALEKSTGNSTAEAASAGAETPQEQGNTPQK